MHRARRVTWPLATWAWWCQPLLVPASILITACAILSPTVAMAGPATHFSVSAPGAATAGKAFNFTVTALDASNGAATGYAGTIQFTSTDGAATLPAGYTFTNADAGAHTFSATLDTTGAQTISATDTVTSSIAGTSNAIADNIGPPTISKLFLPDSISVNSATLLSFTLKNPNSNVTFTGVSFTDALPAGLVVASPNHLSNGCGGTIAATSGSGSISLTGGTVAPGQNENGGECFIAAEVRAASAATYSNRTGAISANESGPGATSNTATLTVTSSSASASPPTISTLFLPSQISPGSSTLLSFTLTNPNAVNFTGVAFTDTLPSGLTVASPNNLSNSCGGTVTASSGSSSITLAGGVVGAIPPLATESGGGECFISMEVKAASSGTFDNTTGAISANESGAGATSNTAALAVTSPLPPTISKSFNASSIADGGTTALVFVISNPNSAALTGVSFTDSLPASLLVATPNALTNSCGGTVTAVPKSTSISLSGGTVEASESTVACSISLLVMGTAVGTIKNTTGAITSAQTGPGSPSNTANLTVITSLSPPTNLSATPQ
jgi:uncharacterized repeat protein (TIGR01451 family)